MAKKYKKKEIVYSHHCTKQASFFNKYKHCSTLRVFLATFPKTIDLEITADRIALNHQHIQVSQFSEKFDEKQRQKIVRFFKRILNFDERFEQMESHMHDMFGQFGFFRDENTKSFEVLGYLKREILNEEKEAEVLKNKLKSEIKAFKDTVNAQKLELQDLESIEDDLEKQKSEILEKMNSKFPDCPKLISLQKQEQKLFESSKLTAKALYNLKQVRKEILENRKLNPESFRFLKKLDFLDRVFDKSNISQLIQTHPKNKNGMIEKLQKEMKPIIALAKTEKIGSEFILLRNTYFNLLKENDNLYASFNTHQDQILKDTSLNKDSKVIKSHQQIKSKISENEKILESNPKITLLYNSLLSKLAIIRGYKLIASKLDLEIKNLEIQRNPENIKKRAELFARAKMSIISLSKTSKKLFDSLEFRAYYRLSILRQVENILGLKLIDPTFLVQIFDKKMSLSGSHHFWNWLEEVMEIEGSRVIVLQRVDYDMRVNKQLEEYSDMVRLFLGGIELNKK